MTVASNYAIAVATLSDWFKSLASIFQPMRSKTKQKSIAASSCTRDFSRAFEQVIARNSDRLIALFAPVLIGRSDYIVIGFSTVI